MITDYKQVYLQWPVCDSCPIETTVYIAHTGPQTQTLEILCAIPQRLSVTISNWENISPTFFMPFSFVDTSSFVYTPCSQPGKGLSGALGIR
jgi:hypothetical protein